MAGQGFQDVVNLAGGIKAWNGLKAAGPVEAGMVLLRGDETPVEIIPIAYGMEEGLRGFYEIMAQQGRDEAVSDLFSKLAGIEVTHKNKLYRRYLTIAPSPLDQADFEGQVASGHMEGGFSTEEFIEQNQAAMETPEDVVSLAMMLETQALDLYMRYSQRSADPETQGIFHDLAEEEKGHLSTLGRLIDARA